MSIRMNKVVSAEMVNTEVVYEIRNLVPGDVVIVKHSQKADGNFFAHGLRLVTVNGLYGLQDGRHKASLDEPGDYLLYFKLKPGVL